MTLLTIRKELDIDEVSKNITAYRFNDPISTEQLIKLATHLSPNQYCELLNTNVLSMLQDEVTVELLRFLTEGTDLNVDSVAYSCKLHTDTIQYIIENVDIDSCDVEYLVRSPNISHEQVLTLIKKTGDMYGSLLGEVVGEKKDVELVKLLLDNWSSLGYSDHDLKLFKVGVFDALGATILSTEDQIEMFGKVRPTMTSNKLRDYEPCYAGWRRVYKWAGRSDTEYSWNEFIARHVLANVQAVEECKEDLIWLASTLSDHRGIIE